MRLWFSTFLCGFVIVTSFLAEARTVRGRVLEKGSKNRVGTATVFVLPEGRRFETARDGTFTLESDASKVTLVVNLAGYKRLEETWTLDSVDDEIELFVEKQSYANPFETVVVGKVERRSEGKKSLNASQFLKVPGAGGDPIKAVQNLPGVARGFGTGALVIIQGSAPEDTRYAVDGHEVPLIFHFGAFTSVVFPESLDRVDYFSAGFGPEWGRTTGGLVTVWTRKPRMDRIHGLGFIDLLNAGAMIEGPLFGSSEANPKHGFLLSFRQSYIGPVLRTALKDDEDFNLTVAPSFGDVSANAYFTLSDRDRLDWVNIGSNDRLEFLLKNPINQDPVLRGNFNNQTSFFRSIPQWTHRHSERATSKYSMGLGRDFMRLDFGDRYFRLRTLSATLRGEHEREVSPEWKTTLGFDNRYSRADVDLKLPVFYAPGGVNNPLAVGGTQIYSVKGFKSNSAALFWRNDIQPRESSSWTLSPSMRGSYIGLSKQLVGEPRASVSYRLTEFQKLRAAGGFYYQPPQEYQIADVVGNPDIKAPSAVHLTTGWEYDSKRGSSRGWSVSTGPFYKIMRDLVVPSAAFRTTATGEKVPENFTNQGSGRAYGWETLLQGNYDPLVFWVSYTLSRAHRYDGPKETYQERIFEFDQTHNLNVIGSWELPRNWTVSSRFRVTTGNPFTPVQGGTFDADNDTYIPSRGPIYSERTEGFYQLDARIDRKWIYRTWILSIYLDVQNVTNRRNVETVTYAYDYSRKADVTGLPIIPTLGVKGEF